MFIPEFTPAQNFNLFFMLRRLQEEKRWIVFEGQAFVQKKTEYIRNIFLWN